MIVNKMIQSTQDLLSQIHDHEFNVELSLGTLPQEKFIFYLAQDALYLADFSRALSLTAARLGNSSDVQQFIQFALDAIQSERELHFGYINNYQSASLTCEVEQSPACFMYTNYLLRMATLAPIEEAVASLLPCFYIYKEVGNRMVTNQSAQHPYHDWIALYSSDAFESSVESAVTITNSLAGPASEKTKDKMVQAFVRSTQLEWLFWHSAYQQEQWDVG